MCEAFIESIGKKTKTKQNKKTKKQKTNIFK